jgi:N-acetyltransferase
MIPFDFQKDIRLENNRSLLRPLQPSDAEGLLAAAVSDDQLMRFSTAPIHNRALLDDYIRVGLDEKAKDIRYPFVVIDKPSGAYAGCTSFANIVNEDERLEIGWTWLGKPFQRSGLNRSNKFLMLEYAFDHLGFERVELRTDERNLQSQTAIKALGAHYEGTLRHYKIAFDGFRRSTVYFSILRSEWKESVRDRLSQT